jgi:hypothetical protein
MSKDPSIHIKKSDLLKVLNEMVANEEFGYNNNKETRFDDFLCHLTRRAKKYALTNRVVIIQDKKEKAKIEKLQTSSFDLTQEFIKNYILVRRSLKMRGNISYDPSHKDWPIIKQLASEIETFAEGAELPKSVAAKEMVKTLFKLNPKGVLNFWVKLTGKALDYYLAEVEIQNDKHYPKTDRFYNCFRQNLIEKVGFARNYKENPLDYVFFVKATKICVEELGCEVEDYVKAQFQGLAWANSYPEGHQLIGDKAKERFTKYAFASNLKVKTKAEINKPKIDWKKLRKAK